MLPLGLRTVSPAWRSRVRLVSAFFDAARQEIRTVLSHAWGLAHDGRITHCLPLDRKRSCFELCILAQSGFALESGPATAAVYRSSIHMITSNVFKFPTHFKLMDTEREIINYYF
jgi:hypothetical protein